MRMGMEGGVKFVPRGIKLVGSNRVEYVRALVGACCPYPNKVTCNTVWYCSSGKAADDRAMHAHIDTKIPVRVYVIDREDPNDRMNNYIWGDAVVVSYTDRTIHRGKLHKRYTLERVGSESRSLVDVDVDATATCAAPAADENAGCDAPPSRAQVDVEVKDDNQAGGATGIPEVTLKRRRPELPSTSLPPQQTREVVVHDDGEVYPEEDRGDLRGKHASKGIVTLYGDHYFKSRLEARTAVFLDNLNISWQYEGVTISYEKKAKTYTVDFHLPDVPIYLEIKPSYPTDEEIEKAMYLCRHQRRDVAIVYNTSFAPPFKRTRTLLVHDEPTIRAMVLRCSVDGVVTWTENCVWKQVVHPDGGNRTVLEPRMDMDDLSWRTDSLLSAYAAAATHAF